MSLSSIQQERISKMQPLDTPVPFKVWGEELIDVDTLEQMTKACQLPISVRGAQMPDGHIGYGLPIGGVLATRESVIPYAVGVDIACRMKLTVADIPFKKFEKKKRKLREVLESETRFGIGARFDKNEKRLHEVMDDPAWDDLAPPLKALKDKAWTQLGTSGSGNHFVEWGEFRIAENLEELEPGSYLSLLSHSGSRGLGAAIAKYFTDIAMDKIPLPAGYKHLAWLSLKSEYGQQYWNAMELAGKYAAANHELIHKHILEECGLDHVYQVENHHNFAWKEIYDEEELIVHRKGATPAGKGVLGIIPGSMADPGYLVQGKGNIDSLNSAAHGAGRVMSRKKAKQALDENKVRKILKERGIELISAGLDEAPMVYKQISEVMKVQEDLVDILAEFHPKMVLMAKGGIAED